LAGHESAIALREIALDGNEGDYINAQKQRNEARPALQAPAQPGTLRWYWNGYKQSDHWLGESQRRPRMPGGVDTAPAHRAD
jgi:hypothetical protein